MNPSSATATLVVDCRCTLGEGIVWCVRRGALLWTDIQGARLWMHVPSRKLTHSWPMPDRLGSFALCESDMLLLGLAKGLAFGQIEPAADRVAVTPLIGVEPDLSTRVNDGRVDRAGNFVFGTMSEERHRIGSFYQYSRHHGLRRLDLEQVAIANSLCFSPDGGTMYFCDSPRRRIMQCDYDAESAAVGNVREFANLASDSGFPDGSTVDQDGGLWNAEWGASTVYRYAPDGRVDRRVAVPVKNPSCVTFGGPTLGEIFVTSARQEMSPHELDAMPHAGGVYGVLISATRGIAESRFKDV